MSIEPQPVPESQRLSETQSRQLLELAIKLDAARSTESSIGELRRVAEELNISPAAFDEALRQIQEQNAIDSAPPATGISLSSPQPATSYLLRVLRIVVLLVGGYYVGVSSAGGGLERVAVVLIGVSAGLAIHDRQKRGLVGYLAEISCVWLTLALGHFLPELRGPIGPPRQPDILFQGWIASLAIGAALMRARWPWKKNADPQNLTAHTA